MPSQTRIIRLKVNGLKFEDFLRNSILIPNQNHFSGGPLKTSLCIEDLGCNRHFWKNITPACAPGIWKYAIAKDWSVAWILLVIEFVILVMGLRLLIPIAFRAMGIGLLRGQDRRICFMNQKELLLEGQVRNKEQVLSLLDSIPDQITAQSNGIANHPAWIVSHLLHYHPAILQLIQGEVVIDPSTRSDAGIFDAGSKPVDKPELYPGRSELVSIYTDSHARIESALLAMPVEQLSATPGLDRWARAFGNVGSLLVYLLLLHESYHAGQLAVWKNHFANL